MKKIWIILLCLLLLVGCGSQSKTPTYSITTPYEYPIVPGTEAWNAMPSAIDRKIACQIPDEILTQMTTQALLESVIRYPFLIDLFAFSTPEMGYQAVKHQFNGLGELETRLDLADTLENFTIDGDSFDHAVLEILKENLLDPAE